SCGSGTSPAGPGTTPLPPSTVPAAPAGPAIPVPKVNGGMNVHPTRCLSCAATDPDLEAELVALQLETIYELGFDGLRITAPIGDRNTLLAVIPYVRAARA